MTDATRYFEDVNEGDLLAFGPYLVDREEVLDFARRYDPQPFHLDEEAAAKTHFGRLAASGWQTMAIYMRMLLSAVENAPGKHAGLGAIGVDELRWLKPVFPGDVLRGESVILEKTPSRSRPEMGVVRSQVTLFNQESQPVLKMQPIVMVRTRPKLEGELRPS